MFSDPQLQKHYNILSCDGGGVRGIIQAVILERLEKEFPNFLRDTDLLVGVSTGGIVALALAAGKKPEEIKNLYLHGAQAVFQGMDGSKEKAYYSLEPLRKVFHAQFGDRPLADLDKRAAILTFDLDNGVKDQNSRTWKAKVFHNLDSPDADMSAKVVDVALATCAAPVYFPSSEGFIDGGVVAGNPAMVGVAQALDNRGPNKRLQNLNLLSLGTGRMGRHIPGEEHDWPMDKWSPFLLNLIFEGATEVIHFQCRQILQNKYCRINPRLNKIVGLDDWRKVPFLLEAAEKEDVSEAISWLDDYWI